MPRASNQGGKQPGAGRKPGPSFPQRTKAVHVATQPDELPVRIRRALTFSARGLSNHAVCQEVGCDVRTLKSWMLQYDDVYRQIIETELADPRRAFAPMLPKAVSAYDKALEVGDTAVAKDVFDRAYGKPIVRQQVETRSLTVVRYVAEQDVPHLGAGES